MMARSVFSFTFACALLLSTVGAFARPEPQGGQEVRNRQNNRCPEIWRDVATTLKAEFSGCSEFSRSAIRFAFHDAGAFSSKTEPYEPASGGADGSLLLNDEEISRVEQAPMGSYRNWLLENFNEWKSSGVGAADLVQFAASVGIRQCRGGPLVTTVVGRKDDSNAAPENMLPIPFGSNATYEIISGLFRDKGFSDVDMAALLGAHSVSKAFASQDIGGIPNGTSQDSTPLKWDNKFYQQVRNPPPGIRPFDSDIAMSQPNTTVGMTFTRFAQDKEAFDVAFVSAMEKLSVLGIRDEDVDEFTDCTSLVGSNSHSHQRHHRRH